MILLYKLGGGCIKCWMPSFLNEHEIRKCATRGQAIHQSTRTVLEETPCTTHRTYQSHKLIWEDGYKEENIFGFTYQCATFHSNGSCNPDSKTTEAGWLDYGTTVLDDVQYSIFIIQSFVCTEAAIPGMMPTLEACVNAQSYLVQAHQFPP